MAVKSTKVTGPGIKPDSRYNSVLVAKFINCIMRDGKKSTAEKSFYTAMDLIGKRSAGMDPIDVFESAIRNVKPMVEVKSKRVGGATYQVPIEVNRKRQQTLAFRWLLQATRSRKGRPFHEKLAAELIDAYNKEGNAIRTRENTHRMAEANKAFAHFAW